MTTEMSEHAARIIHEATRHPRRTHASLAMYEQVYFRPASKRHKECHDERLRSGRENDRGRATVSERLPRQNTADRERRIEVRVHAAVRGTRINVLPSEGQRTGHTGLSVRSVRSSGTG